MKGILSISIRKTGTTTQDHGQDQDRDHGMSDVQKVASTAIALLVYPVITKITKAEDGKAKDEGIGLGQTVEQARMMKDIGHIDDEVDRHAHETEKGQVE